MELNLQSKDLKKYIEKNITKMEDCYYFLKRNHKQLHPEVVYFLINKMKTSGYLIDAFKDIVDLAPEYRCRLIETTLNYHSKNQIDRLFYDTDEWDRVLLKLNLDIFTVEEKRFIIKYAISYKNYDLMQFILDNNFFSKNNPLIQQIEGLIFMRQMLKLQNMA